MIVLVTARGNTNRKSIGITQLSRQPLSIAIGFALAFTASISSASAQKAKSVPQAFAAVQAPEAAVEVCHGTSARAAMDCAQAKCQRKAGRGACFSVTACQPAGWAGVMGVQLAEVHFSNAVCGAPTREAAVASLRAFCQGYTGMKQCAVAQIWSPDGKLVVVDLNWTPADFRK